MGPRSITKVVFRKSSIFIRLTWNLKRSCIFDHWIQPPIIFEVKFVLWILQVSCSARHLLVCYLNNRRFFKYIGQSILLFCLSFCRSVCLSVCRRQVTIPNWLSWNFTSCRGRLNWEAYCFWVQSSEIVIFHSIDLKFEEGLYFRSLN